VRKKSEDFSALLGLIPEFAVLNGPPTQSNPFIQGYAFEQTKSRASGAQGDPAVKPVVAGC